MPRAALAWIVRFEIPQVYGILAVRGEGDGLDKLPVVLRKLVYADKNLRRVDLGTDFVGYLLNDAISGLPAVDDLQAIYPNPPVRLLKSVVAELGAGNRDAIVVEIEVGALIGVAQGGGQPTRSRGFPSGPVARMFLSNNSYRIPWSGARARRRICVQ